MRLLIDGNNVVSRMFYAMPAMMYNGSPTGAIHGFLREVDRLMSDFGTKEVCFAFDSRPYLRNKILPNYKVKPEKVNASNFKKPAHLKYQTLALRDDILPALGFNNVWHAAGYEADDIIAKAVQRYYESDWTIVSTDQDLYQCIERRRVSVHAPCGTEIITEERFTKDHCCQPSQWAWVKAIAGCPSDKIDGIPGVGQFKAIQYVTGKMNPSHASYRAIVDGMQHIARNMKLVSLPMEGTPSFPLKKNAVTPSKCRRVLAEFGLNHSLQAV